MVIEVVFDSLHDMLQTLSTSSSTSLWLPAAVTAIASVIVWLAAAARRSTRKTKNNSRSSTCSDVCMDKDDPAMRNDNGPQSLLQQTTKIEPKSRDENDVDDGDISRVAALLAREHDNAPRIQYASYFGATNDATSSSLERSAEFYKLMRARRSVRDFDASRTVSPKIIENIVAVAGTSPSGANLQPWTFVVISDQQLKAQVRHIIEEEEEMNYKRRMGEKWVKDVSHLGTDWRKPYLEEAPYLIIVMKQSYGETQQGEKQTHYYCDMSVSISVGMMLSAIQTAGLVTVTTTPLNAGPRLRLILNRPANEKVLLLLPVGYPAVDCTVPDISRKPLSEIMINA